MNNSENAFKANILLVDDTPNNLRLLSAMLSDQGYAVRRVVNGQMALTTAQANPPDLILLDIKMPDMNGYEVCQHLKSIEQTQAIPVIFISALDEVLDKVKAFAVGGVDYITKPFSEEEVFARVENILTIRKLQQQLQQAQAEIQQINNRLASSSASYQALFDNPLIGVFQIQPDGLFLRVNQYLIRLLGHDSGSEIVLRKYFSDYFTHPTLEQIALGHSPASHRSKLRSQTDSTGSGVVSISFNPQDNCYEGVFLAECEGNFT